MNTFMNYVDGNAAAGELNRIFAMDITTAEGQCGNCGAKRLFAEAHLYLQCPGLVARCPLCGHVLLRLANIQERVFLDLRGMTHLTFDTAQQSNATS
jgi:DNA-directed RNA polymerase subunit RPC12/RpoP